MSSSLGLGFAASSATVLMIWPAWQYPHCGTFLGEPRLLDDVQALAPSDSIVATDLPAMSPTGHTHDRRARPSTCTVHARTARCRSRTSCRQAELVAQDPQQRACRRRRRR